MVFCCTGFLCCFSAIGFPLLAPERCEIEVHGW